MADVDDNPAAAVTSGEGTENMPQLMHQHLMMETSSEERVTVDEATDAIEETKEPDVKELSRDMFSKAAIYLRGDLAATADDYKLLEKMNRVTSHKYSQMKYLGLDINRALADLNEKYRNLQPYLDQIDQVEESVANLEQAAHRLDAYARRLELKFKQLEKR